MIESREVHLGLTRQMCLPEAPVRTRARSSVAYELFYLGKSFNKNIAKQWVLILGTVSFSVNK